MLDKKPLLLSVNGTNSTVNGPFYPLHLPPPTPLLLGPGSMHSEEELQEIRVRRKAQPWPCGHCVFLLGFLHLLSGMFLLGFDIFTNHITQTPFGVSASLCFLICAILSFIAARRIDKAAQFLLVIFSFISLGICVTIFLQSALSVNNLCKIPDGCYVKDTVIYSILLCISLIESIFCFTTLFICFRSLSEAYFVPRPDSPFTTIIAGDFESLKKRPAEITRCK